MAAVSIKRWKLTEPYLALGTKLGEAPYYHAPTKTIRITDIVSRKLYQIHVPSGPSSIKTFDTKDTCVTTTAEIAPQCKALHGDKVHGKEFIFGGKAGIGVMNRETGEWRYVAKYWNDIYHDQGESKWKDHVKRFRGNDGAVDARGRYFVSIMNDPDEAKVEEEAALFRLDPDLSIHRIRIASNTAIPNGISWSKDNKFIYVTNTSHNEITKYNYDIEKGTFDLSTGTKFFSCPYEGGNPDGHARDAEGYFWIALFGTGKVVRVNEEGQIVAEIELPTRSVTCPGIAGTELWITTAEEEEPDKFPESAKCQGGVWKVDIGVGAAKLYEFGSAS